MNVEFVNPFLESLLNVLRTMAMMEATPGAPEVKKNDIANGDVTGLIGMAGDQAKGTLAITFTEPVIFEITRRMLGEEVTNIDETVTDMVGEITNMVTGGARWKRAFYSS
jgi:chemotaxis protein CheX